MEHQPTVYGYARVSTTAQAKDGNSLEAQEEVLKAAGALMVYSDAYTGTKSDRPELNRLLDMLQEGDTLAVTKLDRIARNLTQGIELINGLNRKGVKVHVLNMGLMDDTPTGRLIRNVMLSFAEFERDTIMERTREGKRIAKSKDGYREGRPKKYSKAQIDHAVSLLRDHSYSQVVEITGISRATLVRARRCGK
ncbi:MAG: recombinase family protein [Lachnospiraceae bacterium]|nr:recombinase family protein [Lachnospiraceae bacterium]